jgi:type VI secretion system Hcp family effector
MKSAVGSALLLASFTLLSASAVQAQGAVETVMCIQGVEGESALKGYENCIVLNSFAQSLTPGRRGARCEGMAMKLLDKASPLLWAAVATGTVYPEVKIVILRANDSSSLTPFFEAKLLNASVASMTVGGEGQPQETVTLIPQAVSASYTPQAASGGSGTPVTTTVYCSR